MILLYKREISSNGHTPTATIVGVTFGVVGAVALTFFAYLLRRRNDQKQADESKDMQRHGKHSRGASKDGRRIGKGSLGRGRGGGGGGRGGEAGGSGGTVRGGKDGGGGLRGGNGRGYGGSRGCPGPGGRDYGIEGGERARGFDTHENGEEAERSPGQAGIWEDGFSPSARAGPRAPPRAGHTENSDGSVRGLPPATSPRHPSTWGSSVDGTSYSGSPAPSWHNHSESREGRGSGLQPHPGPNAGGPAAGAPVQFPISRALGSPTTASMSITEAPVSPTSRRPNQTPRPQRPQAQPRARSTHVRPPQRWQSSHPQGLTRNRGSSPATASQSPLEVDSSTLSTFDYEGDDPYRSDFDLPSSEAIEAPRLQQGWDTAHRLHQERKEEPHAGWETENEANRSRARGQREARALQECESEHEPILERQGHPIMESNNEPIAPTVGGSTTQGHNSEQHSSQQTSEGAHQLQLRRPILRILRHVRVKRFVRPSPPIRPRPSGRVQRRNENSRQVQRRRRGTTDTSARNDNSARRKEPQTSSTSSREAEGPRRSNTAAEEREDGHQAQRVSRHARFRPSVIVRDDVRYGVGGR